MNDALNFKLCGHIRQWDLLTKELVLDKDNLVVDCSFEIALAALLGQQTLVGIALGYTNGRPVTHDLRTLSSLIGIAAIGSTPETQSFTSKDSRGLRTIATMTGIYSPTESTTYDTLGLISNTNLLFAASSFPARTITKPIATEWTIYLRGQ